VCVLSLYGRALCICAFIEWLVGWLVGWLVAWLLDSSFLQKSNGFVGFLQ
jgi:hypothetical protein